MTRMGKMAGRQTLDGFFYNTYVGMRIFNDHSDTLSDSYAYPDSLPNPYV
jgi:hypothetical protein